jgi:hypothetical protein
VPEEVTIPLSVLNNAPFVNDVDDVEFTVPNLQDIREELDDTLPDLDDIQDGVQDVVIDVLDGNAFVDPADLQIVTAIGDEIEDRLDFADLDPDQFTEDILQELRDEIPDLDLDPDVIADAVVEQIDLTPGSAVDVDIDGVFGPLSEDIQEGLTRALEAVAGTEEDLPGDATNLAQGIAVVADRLDGNGPTRGAGVVPDIGDEIGNALDGLPGSDLLSDPGGFIDELAEAVVELLVSEEASESLQETLDNR